MSKVKVVFAAVILAGVCALAASNSTILGNGPEPVPVCPVAVCAK